MTAMPPSFPLLDQGEELEHLKLASSIAGVEADVVLPGHHHLSSGELRLHFLDWGTAGRRTLVFLHGGGLTARTWDLVCLSLREDYRCLALDLRGHGDSDWSPTMDYGLAAQLDDLQAFTDQLDIADFVLVGMSFGAMIALAYAATHSSRLAGLVLVDAAPPFSLGAGVRRIADFKARGHFDSVDELVEHARRFNPRRDPRLLRRSLLHNIRRDTDGRLTWKYDGRSFGLSRLEGLIEEFATLTSVEAPIGCPVLVVRGADSDVLSQRAADEFARSLPNGRARTVPDAGHTVQGDNPRELTSALRQFLAEISL
jgi:esterase